MSDKAIEALKRMVRDRTNIEESRNALEVLLKKGAITPDEVMDFVDAYQEHKVTKSATSVELPEKIVCYLSVNYQMLRDSIAKGWTYLPMTRIGGSLSSMDDEMFEITLPIKGYKKVSGKWIGGGDEQP